MTSAASFGARMRELRIARDMSLADLSRAVHYSKSQLSKIENDHVAGNLRLAHLCDVVLETGGALAALFATGQQSRRRGVRPDGLAATLPRDTPHFVGRATELARLLDFLVGPAGEPQTGVTRICVVHGMPGVGKTALAIRAAHRAASLFPDGCLFLDLHGYTPGVPRLSAADALDSCLRRLGVSGDAIPPQPDDRAAVLRDLLADRRTLVVLDNAVGLAQVTPLLPAASAGAVVITSRQRLAALDDADHIEVDILPTEHATELFRSVAHLDSADGAVADIVTACGRLPLAIRVAAARCRDQPTGTLDELADRLADDATSIAELDDGERTATAAFDASCESLPADQHAMFLAVARHPGADFDLAVAAAMADVEPPAAQRLLARLVDAHLVGMSEQRRYRLHDLVRAYAAAAQPDDAALRRALDHYVVVAQAADALISPHRRQSTEPAVPPRAGMWLPAGRADAVAWLDAEHANVVAACRVASAGDLPAAWQLANALRGYFFLVKKWDDWVATHEQALESARRRADRYAQAHLLNNLGLAHFERGRTDLAADCYDHALTLFRELGDTRGVCSALGNTGWVHIEHGRYAEALAAHRHALAYHQRAGTDVNLGVTLRGVAIAEAGLRAFDDAIEHLERARAIFEGLELPLDEAMALNCLGEVHTQRGDPAAALDAHRKAMAAARLCGSTFEEARARSGMAGAATDPATRERHLAEALELYESLRAPEADRVRRDLATARTIGRSTVR